MLWCGLCFKLCSRGFNVRAVVWFQIKAFETTYKVGDLTEGKEYLFGVAAENEVGLGKVMETEIFIKAAKPLGKFAA